MARAEATFARTDTRAWAVERRTRTRQLIELGGLIHKAGLVDLTDDDRAALLGAFLYLSDELTGERRRAVLALWRRRGKRAFEAAELDSPATELADDPQCGGVR
jgi:hypothetical protein